MIEVDKAKYEFVKGTFPLEITKISIWIMKNLIKLAKKSLSEKTDLPFSIYSSSKEQRIANVPIIKPLLIFILGGSKKLGKDGDKCHSGSFVFLSNSPNIDMRNIPDDEEYFAVLIEFEYSDFNQFKFKQKVKNKYFKGEINSLLERALQQFIELSMLVEASALNFRKQELLQLLYLSGYEEVSAIAEPPSISQQIYDIINEKVDDDWSVDRLASKLFMSDSTLRRKLKSEGSSIKEIRTRTRLGYGLHLIQTTMEGIGRISMRCGYQSQSRFTEQFKQLFGVTPTELRKTKLND
ncbi:AraC family transcriptional regulator [Moritella sp.]|uniref:helix-turn-helix transcriptional regulator n=1 Tax=Moritella sp. TaxID=78556 RepID=UPI0025EC462B|nr:AraC family transcriptional regulator [Moritella sp.]